MAGNPPTAAEYIPVGAVYRETDPSLKVEAPEALRMDALGYLQTTAQGLPLSIAMGATPGASIVNKFGFNEAISNTEITLWFQGGLYTYPTDAAGKIDMLLFDN